MAAPAGWGSLGLTAGWIAGALSASPVPGLMWSESATSFAAMLLTSGPAVKSRLQPPEIDPGLVPSSPTTYRLQVPFAGGPLNTESAETYEPAAAGAGRPRAGVSGGRAGRRDACYWMR